VLGRYSHGFEGHQMLQTWEQTMCSVAIDTMVRQVPISQAQLAAAASSAAPKHVH